MYQIYTIMKPEDIFPKGKVTNYREETIKSYFNIKIDRITFHSTFPLNNSKNDRVVVYHYQTTVKESKKAIVIIHGWKSISLLFEKFSAFFLAIRGFHTFLLILPFHFERTLAGKKSGEQYFTLDQHSSSNAFKQTIVDLRNLADIIIEKGYIPGIMGSSLGGVALHTLMGVDRRYVCGVSILGGGNIHRIVWEGLLGRFVVAYLKKRGITKKDYIKTLDDFNRFLQQVEKSRTIPQPKFHWFLLDPLTYASFNQPRKVLMINGLFDMIIPRKSALELHRALGKPEILWLPAFHLTILIFTPLILLKIIQFFKKQFPS
jgi:pimeloyl-ACP methyl ester carboxylesterase